MKVIVACEESQTVCKAFRERGHEAYSCDVQLPSGCHPEWHILGDATEALRGGCVQTMDMTLHEVGRWDLAICHPPCTYLSNAGAARLFRIIDGESYIYRKRFEKGLDAKDFFMEMFNANAERIAVENPVPSGIFRLPKYTQLIEPYEYGHPYRKKTCLWLVNLPMLRPTNIVEPTISWVSGGSKRSDGSSRENQGMKFRDSKTKSKTFQGIADAMADQWGKISAETRRNITERGIKRRDKMRLIDADALAKAFREASETDDSKDNRTYWSEALISAAEEVDDAPTVSPDMAQVLAYECGKAERKRGKWMLSSDDAEGVCTVCQYKIYGRPYQGHYLIVPYNYCPNCGADMRGESE